jgi:hypothetical protein
MSLEWVIFCCWQTYTCASYRGLCMHCQSLILMLLIALGLLTADNMVDLQPRYLPTIIPSV